MKILIFSNRKEKKNFIQKEQVAMKHKKLKQKKKPLKIKKKGCRHFLNFVKS